MATCGIRPFVVYLDCYTVKVAVEDVRRVVVGYEVAMVVEKVNVDLSPNVDEWVYPDRIVEMDEVGDERVWKNGRVLILFVLDLC